MAAAANATTTRIGAHLGRREIMLGFISKFHVRDACGNAATPSPVMKSRPPILIPLPLISFQAVLDWNAMEPRVAKNLLALPLPELAHRRRFAFIYLMTAVFQNAIFQDEDAARRALDLICDSRCGTEPCRMSSRMITRARLAAAARWTVRHTRSPPSTSRLRRLPP